MHPGTVSGDIATLWKKRIPSSQRPVAGLFPANGSHLVEQIAEPANPMALATEIGN